jgi:hypothetical protein
MFLWSVWFIVTNGRLYVHWPRLVPLEFAPDITGRKRHDRFTVLEKGEGKGHRRDASVSSLKGSSGVLGALFGKWVPGAGRGEDVDVLGVGRAHEE